MKTYTIAERAKVLYQTVVDVFDYSSTSDIVTPTGAIEAQLDSLPSLKGKILVPGAGIGSYVNALIQRGVEPSDIYAVEISPVTFRLGSRMFSRLGVNYIHADFLIWEPEMEFDVVIGNPPYHKSKYSDFYVCFMQRASEVLKDGGFFSMIAPAKGAQPLSRAQKPLGLIGWNYVEFGIEPNFPNVGTVIANYVGTKGKKSEHVTVKLRDDQFDVPKGTVFPLDSYDRLAYSVVAKIFGFEEKMPFLRQKTEPSGKYLYVSRLIGTWHPNKPKGGPYALKTFKNEAPEQNDGGFLMFNSDAEVEHASWVISRSLVMRFAVNRCGKAAFIAPMFWSLMPDLLACKSDEEMFVNLGLTSEEVNYIKTWEESTY